MNKNETPDFTPTDEKVLASHYVWLGTVRALQIQGSLDLSILSYQLQQAVKRLSDIGETVASSHVLSHLKQIEIMMQTPLQTPSEDK